MNNNDRNREPNHPNDTGNNYNQGRGIEAYNQKENNDKYGSNDVKREHYNDRRSGSSNDGGGRRQDFRDNGRSQQEGFYQSNNQSGSHSPNRSSYDRNRPSGYSSGNGSFSGRNDVKREHYNDGRSSDQNRDSRSYNQNKRSFDNVDGGRYDRQDSRGNVRSPYPSNRQPMQDKRHAYNRSFSGSSSGSTRLSTNFFPIRMVNDRRFFIYSFSCSSPLAKEDFDGEIANKYSEDDRIWCKRMLESVYFKFNLYNIYKGKKNWVSGVQNMPFFDGCLIVSVQDLGNLTGKETLTYKRSYNGNVTEIPFNITVSKVSEVSPLFQGTQDVQLDQAITFCLETIFGMIGMVKLGTAVCDSDKKGLHMRGLKHNYLVQMGVIPSLIFVGTSGLFMNLTFKQKIRSSTPFIEDIVRMKRQLSPQALSHEYEGKSIVYNNKSFIIKCIDSTKTPLSTFNKGGKEITYVDYYKERYNINIKNKDQPLIQVMVKMRNQKKQINYLIPEFCYLSGLQNPNDIRKIPGKSVAEKDSFVCNVVSQILGNSNARNFCSDLGLEIDPKPLTVEPKVLEPPKVEDIILVGRSGQWNVKKEVIRDYFNELCEKKGKKWVVVGRKETVGDFLYAVNDILPCGDKLQPTAVGRNMIEVNVIGRGDDIINSLNKKVHDWSEVAFVFVLLQNDEKGPYINVKTYLSCTVGVPSQCIVTSREWEKRLFNCVVQMAVKAGCKIWKIGQKKFIAICGIDIQRRGNHFKGGVTFSYDSGASLYNTSTFREVEGTQAACVEAIKCLENGMDYFKKRNKGGTPEAVIIYNSGQDSLDLTKHIEAMGKYYSKRFCLINANKDSNARFTMDGQNVKVGTCINSLSRNQKTEYYITSVTIQAKMGLSKPVRYEIAFNHSSYSPSDLENITFEQTHMYYNWNGSVKLPACVLYAKKAVELEDAIKMNPHSNLNTSLHFL
jgi:aubergine-like protein